MGRRDFEVEVESTWMMNDFVKALTMRRVDGQAFRVHPGQFFMLHLEHDGHRINRSYSVSNRVGESRELEAIEWCVALVEGGIGSAAIAEAEPGTKFTLTGPHGRFVIRGTPAHLVLVATGTGIAPYRSMIDELRRVLGEGSRVDLVMGARHESDLLYDDEFLALAEECEGFGYHRALSRVADPESWSGEGRYAGRVQAALAAVDYDAETVFYLCGNPQMVDDVRASLMEEGLERRQIRTEAYVSPPDLDAGGNA